MADLRAQLQVQAGQLQSQAGQLQSQAGQLEGAAVLEAELTEQQREVDRLHSQLLEQHQANDHLQRESKLAHIQLEESREAFRVRIQHCMLEVLISLPVSCCADQMRDRHSKHRTHMPLVHALGLTFAQCLGLTLRQLHGFFCKFSQGVQADCVTSLDLTANPSLMHVFTRQGTQKRFVHDLAALHQVVASDIQQHSAAIISHAMTTADKSFGDGML